MASMLYIVTHGTDNPFKATTPFEMAAVAADSEYEVQIAMLGDSVLLLREGVFNNLHGLGNAPFREAYEAVVARGIPVYVCGTCMKTRDVPDGVLAQRGANPMDKGVFVELVAHSDNVVTF